MTRILIAGTGLWTPPESITNAELVTSLLEATQRWNQENADAITRGELEERDPPSDAFIVKASGVRNRYVIEKQGVLDPERMRPRLPLRSEE